MGHLTAGNHSTTISGFPTLTGTDATEPASPSRVLTREAVGVFVVFAQAAAVALVARQLDLFTPAFRNVLLLAAAGFVAHHLLPMRHRMAAFAVLCAAALVYVMGGSASTTWDPIQALQRTIPIVAIGAAIAGICVLPIAFGWRVALLTAVGAGVALLRIGLFASGSLAIAWAVLAAMFMFRVIVYAYEVSTAKRRPTIAESFGYLFMFPNICVGLFPVVDFKGFVRSHYDGDALAIYQRGAHWMIRGVWQLLGYRLISQMVALRPEQVANGRDLIQYVLSNSFLYLNVSGQFHLFIGLLLLFGFNLPETHRRYFLASSFTDYWRRVNIYWKDFILTVFYYPLYFRLKQWGPTTALVLATLWSFFATWALHLYQTWWLTGSATMTAPDALFWGVLGVLVIVNSLWEMKRGRQRRLASSAFSTRDALSLMVRTAATFCAISLLWSLWSCSSVSQWIGLWRYADRDTIIGAVIALTGIMTATLLLEVKPLRKRSAPKARAESATFVASFGGPLVQCALLLLVCVVAMPSFQARLDAATLQPWYDALNTGDSMVNELMTRNAGYYERLTTADPADTQRFETMNHEEMPAFYSGEDPIRPVNDFRFREFEPDVHVHAYDTDFSTNQWGMRDREYAQAKPAGVLRIAVLGSSHTMGWGVPADDTFEAIVERRLNTDSGGTTSRPSVEMLNFAQNGLSLLGDMSVLEKRVGAFEPDIVLLVTHPLDASWVVRDLPRSVRQNVPVPYPYLTDILHRARITARTHQVLAQRRLVQYEPALLNWSYERIVEQIRAMDALPVAVLVPLPNDVPLDRSAVARQIASMQAAGFVAIDLSRIYDHEDPATLRLADGHSNARAHALIANALQTALVTNQRIDFEDRVHTTARHTQEEGSK